ncbi:vitamin B12 transporter [Verrucomicrobium sp. GAS474]|uniref:TonB-dependent receptor n=1 Tax=Verrucomicrobium sp. GAS474 TaxID=1882831 RepID=UPI00087C9986|nr:TonB-dependent receptor [Verrucomicrobium sp. GAS474]SDT93792.1 vitamin B12 transporter [Verrucomicrobium sp. GAS474]
MGRKSALRLLPLSLLGWGLGLGALSSREARGEEAAAVPLPVVTVTGAAPGGSAGTGTAAVYDQAAIETIRPFNLTDLLSQNSFGFSVNYSPGHTLFNIRGALTAAQGWDDVSQIPVLVNGRRAGTANIGKLSTEDAARVEVSRGPASVAYDSTASMGGVVNLVTKDGTTAPGNRVTGTFGSFDRYTGQIESGGKEKAFDWYVSATGSTSGNYTSGSGSAGTMPNTAYDRGNLNLTLGYDLDATGANRIEVIVRHDGVYDAGHPGLTYSLTDTDTRMNTSVDAIYTGAATGGGLRWSDHFYYVQDVDIFDWPQNPFIGLAASGAGYYGTPGVLRDRDARTQNLAGDKIAFTVEPTESNTLLAGVDLEHGWLENTRSRVAAPGYPAANPFAPAVNLPPTEYNNESYMAAVYAEDAQRFLDDRLVLQAGGRFQFTNAKLLGTEYQTASFDSAARNAGSGTYRVASAYEVRKGWKLRASVGTGFRAVTPGELHSATQQGNGFTVSGNPNLKDEYSLTSEYGVHGEEGPLSADLAYFRNTIHNSVVSLPTATPLVYTWRNIDREKISGLEAAFSYDLARLGKWAGYRLEPYATGSKLFQFDGEGVPYALSDSHMLKIDDYQATLGLRGGKIGKWSSDWYAVWSGPSYESAASEGYTADSHLISQVPSWWVLNMRQSYEVTASLSLFFGINNLLDRDYDPASLGLNRANSGILPKATAGGLGSSAPGREFLGGFVVSF